MSLNNLKLEKEIILDKIFGILDTPGFGIDGKLTIKNEWWEGNSYNVYSAYEKMIHYAERYNEVSNKIELTIKEKADKNFAKIFEETR